MPPRRFSRHTFTLGFFDTGLSGDVDERLQLTERAPFEFRVLADNRHHVVSEGETLQSIAARYFASLFRPAGLWWVIADFQPDPVHDPTLTLETGTVLIIPSERTVQEFVFSEQRRLGEVPVV